MQRIRRRWLRCVGVLSAATTIPLLCLLFAQAAVFECMESPGNMVMTDSPSQLTHCRVISENAAAASRRLDPVIPEATGALQEPGPSQKADNSHSLIVPLQRIDSLFVVSIMVNNTREARLIVDTGASHTILSRSIAQDAALFKDAHTTQVTMQTVGGQVQGQIVHVDSIKVFEAEVKNSMAAIYDLPDAPQGVEGLLGLSFLRHFEVKLDSTRNQLHLEKITP